MEGEGPTDLSGAGVRDGACALGPWVVPAEYVRNPYAPRIACGIRRGAVLWQGEASTSGLHQRLDGLVSHLTHAGSSPGGAYLLAGIPLAPPDSVSLQAGDLVEVAIEGLGVLRNPLD